MTKPKDTFLVARTVNEQIAKSIRVQLKSMDCDHVFHENGSGYLCGTCGYHTGNNSLLNNLLK